MIFHPASFALNQPRRQRKRRHRRLNLREVTSWLRDKVIINNKYERIERQCCASFWNQRYSCGETPWTVHAIPATLRSFVKRTRARGRVLIPGCGTDHEVIQFFQSAGFDVIAIDFSTVAVAQIKKALGNFDGKIIQGNFCKFDSQAGLI